MMLNTATTNETQSNLRVLSTRHESAASRVHPAGRVAGTGVQHADFLEAFSRYFEVIPADTGALREQVFRLRYQVYCVETRFERAGAFPDGLERDSHDGGSRHALLRHRRTGWWAGTVRLVLPDCAAQAGGFPVERACGKVFSPERMGHRDLPRHSTVEVSRFAVSKEFRRRYKEYLSPMGISDDTQFSRSIYRESVDGATGRREQRDDERRMVPHIALGLIQASVTMSIACGVSHWVVAIEPSLLRLFERIGIYFDAVGQPVEYHGRRQPCIADLAELLKVARRVRPDVWAVLTRGGVSTP